jgi:hypothetical protein
LINYYRAKGLIIDLDASGEAHAITDALVKKLKK